MQPSGGWLQQSPVAGRARDRPGWLTCQAAAVSRRVSQPSTSHIVHAWETCLSACNWLFSTEPTRHTERVASIQLYIVLQAHQLNPAKGTTQSSAPLPSDTGHVSHP